MATVEAEGDIKEKLASLRQLVGDNLSSGKSAEALENATTALTLLRERQDSKGSSQLLREITGLSFVQERPKETLRLAVAAAGHFRRNGDREGEAYGQLAAAAGHSAQGEALKAVQAINLAISLFQKLGLKDGECTAQQVASKVHIMGSDAKEAMKAAEKARTLSQSLVDCPEAQAASMLAVAEAHAFKASKHYADENSWKKASQAAQLALESYREIGDVTGEAAASLMCSRADAGVSRVKELVANGAPQPGSEGTIRRQYQEMGQNMASGRQGLMFEAMGGRVLKF